VILWSLANEAAKKWQPGNCMLVEITCTRRSTQLFAVR
jgi:hypothetical protein